MMNNLDERTKVIKEKIKALYIDFNLDNNEKDELDDLVSDVACLATDKEIERITQKYNLIEKNKSNAIYVDFNDTDNRCVGDRNDNNEPKPFFYEEVGLGDIMTVNKITQVEEKMYGVICKPTFKQGVGFVCEFRLFSTYDEAKKNMYIM